MTEDHERAAELLTSHPAVAKARVSGATELTAYLIPDEREAPLLHRSGLLQARGRLAGLSWHEPSVDLRLAQVNRSETDFLYREIFVDNAYFRHGIALPEDAVVVDVGANIGMFTLAAAAHSARIRIVAVEPVAESARALAVNAELHGIDVTVVNCGLGAEAGEAEFTYYPHNSVMSGYYADADEDQAALRGYLLTSDDAERGKHLDKLVTDRMAAERRRYPVLTLTDIVHREHIDTIDLLKIDVEKAESDVLAGMDAKAWDKVTQIVIEVHDLDGRLGRVLTELTHRGFEVTHDRDDRLALTPCHTVYGRRPTARRQPAATPAPPRLPTVRALAAELRAILADAEPRLPEIHHFELVTSLAGIAAPATGSPRPVHGPGTTVLAEIWAELFGAGSVRDDADFFDLGGDSLTAVRLLARLETRLGADVLALDAVFTSSRFGELAAAVEAGVTSRQSVQRG